MNRWPVKRRPSGFYRLESQQSLENDYLFGLWRLGKNSVQTSDLPATATRLAFSIHAFYM